MQFSFEKQIERMSRREAINEFKRYSKGLSKDQKRASIYIAFLCTKIAGVGSRKREYNRLRKYQLLKYTTFFNPDVIPPKLP
jgi:hypothetical protein